MLEAAMCMLAKTYVFRPKQLNLVWHIGAAEAEGWAHLSSRRLEGLGSPEEAGQRFLSSTIAPRGLGLEAQLLSATQRWPCRCYLAAVFMCFHRAF
jgi:hypothetical protein